MERNFYTDDFEQFLREKSDEHQMFPSDSVWKKIYRQLHVYRRWTMFGFSAIILGVTFLGGRLLLDGTDQAYLQADLKKAPEKDSSEAKAHPLPPNKLIVAINNLRERKLSNLLFQDIAESNNPPLSVAWVKPAVVDSPAVTPPMPEEQQAPAAYAARLLNPGDLSFLAFIAGRNHSNAESGTELKAPASAEVATAVAGTAYSETPALPENPELVKIGVPEPPPLTEEERRYVEAYALEHMPSLRKKLSFQFYATPGISYRKMTDRNHRVNLNAFPTTFRPMAADHIDIDRYVTHHAMSGVELGGALNLKLTDALTFKGGLQFNLSRYRINAYNYGREMASIAINDPNKASYDTVHSFATLRNFSGYSRTEVENDYLQVSIPLGLDLRIFGNNQFSFNLGGTIQPSYLMNTGQYMLSTDYRNYTKVPDLVRRWNINAGLEAFFAYEKKGLRWQLGPQLRYQLLSTYDKRYPIHEYLINYGFKIGVSRTILR